MRFDNSIKSAYLEEKADLIRQRVGLSVQFENLANKILEDKSKKFTEQNKTNLDALLKPSVNESGISRRRSTKPTTKNPSSGFR